MAINDVSLTSGMRSNLISLQGTVDLLNRTQDRLSTGKKVNTALDNPLNFFTAKALNSRASDLAGFKDGMSEAVQTIKAANNGITAIEGLLAQAKAVAATAKAGVAGTVNSITVDLASVTNGQTITVGSNTFTAMADLQKTVNFSALAVGDTVTIGTSAFTAVAKQQEVNFSALAVGNTVTIGASAFTAVAKQQEVNFSALAINDTVTIGTSAFTAVGKEQTVEILGTIASGDSITIGSTTYAASAGAEATAGGTVYIDLSTYTTAVSFAAELNNLLATDGVTASITGATLTLDVATSAGTVTDSGANTTIADRALAADEFLVSSAYGTTVSSAYAADAFITAAGLTGATTSGGIVTLSVATSAGTVAETGGATITDKALAADEFLISSSYGTTVSSAYAADAFITAAGLTGATTSGGIVTLSVATSAGTVAETGGATITDKVLADGEFLISSSYGTTVSSAYAADAFLTEAGLTGATTSAGIVTLSVATSLGTVGTSGIATIADTLTATQFYLGATPADATAAANLAAKINALGELSAATNAGEITITSGTVTITGGTVSELATTFTTEVNQTSTDRASYAGQFNTIMEQLDLLATDSGYKGINFLAAGNSLDVEFGSDTGDKITLTSFDGSAAALLGKEATAQNGWSTNADVDVDLAGLTNATATLKTESSRLSSGLSIINTRQDWVKAMVNTVTEGADKLTLADMNEEGANMLMLQTRQTLGTTALSLSAQAAQSVLRLFG